MAKSAKKDILFIGVDPGKKGALVGLNSEGALITWPMPLTLDESVDFPTLMEIIERFKKSHECYFFLERAVSFGMGMKQAFNYGRGFAALEIALAESDVSITYVEPAKWTKLVHEGIDKGLKPKVKSAIALKRLMPSIALELPKDKKGVVLEGPMDAALIAYYGSHQVTGKPLKQKAAVGKAVTKKAKATADVEDFYQHVNITGIENVVRLCQTVSMVLRLAFLLLLASCCKGHDDYKINGEWKTCTAYSNDCGLTLDCKDGTRIECGTNIETKGRCE